MAGFTDEQRLIFTARVCPYCGGTPELVDAREIFGPGGARFEGKYYLCRRCRASVGCHRYSTEAMGRLATAELRDLRRRAHAVFDLIWKDRHKPSRYNAYSWLSLRLGKPRHLVHMAYFDETDCRRVISICTAYLKSRNPEKYADLPGQ